MKNKALFFALVPVFLFCGTAPAGAQEKVLLKYDFRRGDTMNYRMTMQGDVVIRVPLPAETAPAQTSAQIKGEFNYVHEVREINRRENTVEIDVTYGEAVMETIMGDQRIPNEDAAAISGKTARITVSPSGEVVRFIPPAQLPDSFQGADFRKMFVVFPPHPLRVGESWLADTKSTREKTALFDAELISHTKYTLLGVEKKGAFQCARVGLESKTRHFSKPAAEELNVHTTVETNVDGVIYFNLAGGYAVYSDLRSEICNEVSAKDRSRPEAGAMVTTIITNLHTITQLQ